LVIITHKGYTASSMMGR